MIAGIDVAPGRQRRRHVVAGVGVGGIAVVGAYVTGMLVAAAVNPG